MTIESGLLEFSACSPIATEWPKLTCSAPNELALQESDLLFSNGRALHFQGDGQISTGGNLGIGTNMPAHTLDVNGVVNATDFLRNGAPLVSSQWADASGDIHFSSGNVGIGTASPQDTLDVNGALRFNGNADRRVLGDLRANRNTVVVDGNWNELEIKGRVIDWTGSNLHIGYDNDHSNHFIEMGRNVGYISLLSGGGSNETMRIAQNGNVEMNGNLRINGSFSLPKTSNGSAWFTNRLYYNENRFENNNLKLSLDSIGPFGIPGGSPLTYEFAVGHESRGFAQFPGGGLLIVTSFRKKFSINHTGDLYCSGSKAGYVVDYFVNQVGEPLEQGDVVVIGQQEQITFTGSDNNIPLPEVNLTNAAYDSRVCGIVAKAVTEQGLPFVEPEQLQLTAAQQKEAEKLLRQEGPLTQEKDAPVYVHPLKQYATKPHDGFDFSKVQDKQMGQMVTLGAFAHCKVDADIAPISAGDLLTTSPTRGHAQKVLDRPQATGAIIGKALAGLDKGQGKIPVLVMMQ